MELIKEHELEKKGLSMNVKLTETDIFKELLKECSSILEDERIDKNIRKEYNDRFEKLFNKQEEK